MEPRTIKQEIQLLENNDLLFNDNYSLSAIPIDMRLPIDADASIKPIIENVLVPKKNA